MNELELTKGVMNKEAEILKTEKDVLEWALKHSKAIKLDLVSIISIVADTQENDNVLFHLNDANTAISIAINELKEFDTEDIDTGSGSPKWVDTKALIDSKKKVCEFVSFWYGKHDKMADTDKMSGRVVRFLKEMDIFEEEVYNVV